MSLDVREVHHVAGLARLRLTAEQERRFADQLSRVLDYIEQIRSAAAAEATIAAGADRHDAADEPAPCLERDRFLANAPAVAGPFLTVPRVLGGDDA